MAYTRFPTTMSAERMKPATVNRSRAKALTGIDDRRRYSSTVMVIVVARTSP